MRIAQVAPLAESVPPQFYGGTERVVSGLTEELVRRGHDVVLFASGDSDTSAELVACCPEGLRLNPGIRDHVAYTMIELGMVSARAREFDIIHSHLDYLAMPTARQTATPMVTTLHGRLDLPELQDVYAEFSEQHLVSISNAQRRPLSHVRWLATVYNGIDLRHFTLREGSGGYLAFLGRISPEKGVDRAIEIAQAVDMPLRIAAKIDPVDREYFTAKIKPLLRDPRVEYIGEIDETQKDEFLGNAFAYLFPINWPEPFGMTMIEAMACGTPVIAMNFGSVPEVVVDGQTGFVCRSQAEMIDAVQRTGDLSRNACRAHVENHFSAFRMAEMYETAYRTVMEQKFDYAGRGVRRSSRGAIVDEARDFPGIQRQAPLARRAGSGIGIRVVGAGRTGGST
ncbi:MAG TPA: glycosyltransferase family 4 protein [bacterium]|nr:glycosyltransferase family 4 protein [bacterium]